MEAKHGDAPGRAPTGREEHDQAAPSLTHARLRDLVAVVERAFDIAALTLGEQHPLAQQLSLAMREAARLAVGVGEP